MRGDPVVATGDRFLVEEEREGRTVVVTGPWSPAAAAALRRGDADGLDLNYARGFAGRDLAFLGGLPVRRLKLLARTIRDVEPLYGLADTLASVAVEAASGTVLDLARLPYVHTVQARWPVVAGSLSATPGLRRLYTSGFPEPDLRVLAANHALATVVVKDAPALRTLAGVDALPSLNQLKIALARRLEDIDDLAGASRELYELDLEDCPRLPRLDAYAHLPSLRRVGFSDCGDVESVAPLRSLRNVEVVEAWGSTRVVDGDLSPIAALPRLRELRMHDRAVYRPRVKEIQARLGT